MSTNATLGNATHLLTLAGQKNLTKEGCDALVQTGLQADLYEAAEAGQLTLVSRGAFRRFLGLPPTSLTAILDYSLLLDEMVQLGKYDWTIDRITAERFPLAGEGQWEVEYELVHLNRNISSDNAETEIKKRGLEPAKIEELLAFGAKYPELQRRFPIVALGSVTLVAGNRYVACLYRVVARRSLRLFFWDDDWRAVYRFLAVRNRRRLEA